MKHSPRDALTILCLAVLLAVGGAVTWALWPWLNASFGGLASVAVVVTFCLATGLIGLGYLRALNRVFPLKPGIYDMDDAQCFLWKHHAIMRDVCQRLLRPFFPLFLSPVLGKLLGMRLGRDATLATHGVVADPILTELGDHAVVGENACVTAHAVTDNKLILDPVVIGAGATVGIHVTLMPGVRIG